MVRLTVGLQTFRRPLLAGSGARHQTIGPTISKMAIRAKSARVDVFEWQKFDFFLVLANHAAR
jgi:hypothetical protein